MNIYNYDIENNFSGYKIAFIQKSAYEKISVHYLAGALKIHNFEYDVFIEELEEDFYSSIKEYNPNFIIYSLFIGEEIHAFDCLRVIKKILPNAITIVGGPFTLVFPEIYKNNEIDYILRGDGEYTLPELLKKIILGKDISNVNGVMFYKDEANNCRNDNINLVDLKSINKTDRDLYFKYNLLRDNPTKMLIASRGCPYQCTYCYNVELSKCFSEDYWRLRETKDIIDEVKYLTDNYKTDWIYFPDGTFTANRKWLKDFLEVYTDSDLPEFLCNARVENLDEEIIKLLKKAGCNRITFGIQTGNDDIRRNISGRNMSNEKIIEICELTKKYNIRVGIDIIFGWPEETIEQAMDTIRLCRIVNVESYSSNVLIFYPGLSVTEYALQNGYIDRQPTLSDISKLNPNKSLLISPLKNQLINFDKLFYLLIKLPKFEKIFLLLAKLPPNKFFMLLKNIHFLLRSFKYDKNKTKFTLVKNYISSSLKSVKN